MWSIWVTFGVISLLFGCTIVRYSFRLNACLNLNVSLTDLKKSCKIKIVYTNSSSMKVLFRSIAFRHRKQSNFATLFTTANSDWFPPGRSSILSAHCHCGHDPLPATAVPGDKLPDTKPTKPRRGQFVIYNLFTTTIPHSASSSITPTYTSMHACMPPQNLIPTLRRGLSRRQKCGLVHSQIKLNYCSFPHDSAVQQRAARVAIQELLLKFSPIQWARELIRGLTSPSPARPVPAVTTMLVHLQCFAHLWFMVIAGNPFSVYIFAFVCMDTNRYQLIRKKTVLNCSSTLTGERCYRNGTTTSAAEHILDHTAW